MSENEQLELNTQEAPKPKKKRGRPPKTKANSQTKKTTVNSVASYKEGEPSKFDTTGFDKDTIADWYKLMHLGRRLDEKAALYLKMAKGWSYHAPYAGHDGIQLALGKIFRSGKDFLFPYYRDMMTTLSAGLTVDEIILNGLSKDGDVAGGGRHMSNHFAKPSVNIQNGSSCTGNHSLHAVGTARAIKKYKGDEISYYSGGDSACSEGFFMEAINFATLEQLPIVFVIQNNKYGISVPIHEGTGNVRVSDNFIGFKNLKIINCDGRDPFASYRALEEAKEHVLAGGGPVMVHADCDRLGSHSNSDNHELYRPKEVIEEMKTCDPLSLMRALVIDKKILSEKDVENTEAENKQAIFDSADRVEPMADPDPNSYKDFIVPDAIIGYDDASENSHKNDPSAKQFTLREAINEAMIEEFRSNKNTFLWGQDVASVKKQGIFNVCKGMLDEFGNERVFNAPIAEDGIVGTANGMCRYRDDIRVVVEGAEFADYFWPAMEQLIECSHDYWRTKGQFSPNITIRLASGGYIQGGLYHSQNLDAVFAHLPGLRVVCPSFADDAFGLMRNSIRSKGVTLFLEPKFLYNFRPTSASRPADNVIVPFGKAKVRKEGSDITIITYGNAMHATLRALPELEKANINPEIIDLRSLRPWDRERVFESVKKTSRAVVAHEHYLTGGLGGEIAASIGEELFRYLDAPVARVASKDVPVGFAKGLENATLLQPKDIVATVKKTVQF
jgi:2-oxoisovalerate dehydrogenase E1 component